MIPLSIAPLLGMVTWHPRLSPVLCGALLVCLGAAVRLLFVRLRARLSRRRTLLLLAPRVAVLAFLALALFDPAWTTEQRVASQRRLLLLVDRSSSMDVRDDGRASRLDRARRAARELADAAGGREAARVMEFDTALHEPGEAPGDAERGTGLASALLAVTRTADLSSADAVVLLTDGGDERVANPVLPAAPVHVVGFGTDPAGWRDIAIADVTAPKSVEKDVDFEIVADVLRRKAAAADARSRSARVRFEAASEAGWQKLDERTVDLSYDRARVRFKTKSAATGLHRYRVVAEADIDELTLLNNRREFGIETRSKSLHVLYFTRELSTELKMIRNELASDPGVTFTALYRTVGERFTVQGERLAGDDDLPAGFPDKADVLELFDCLIIGSFPSTTWRKEQMDALVEYVNRGGAVIFLGGEESFGRGSYSTTPLAALFPWATSPDEDELARGTFAVTIPQAAGGHPVLAGLAERFSEAGGASVESANVPGALKPGAALLLEYSLGGRLLPLAATQRYGQGSVLAFASNTAWKWALASTPLKTAYGLFWRQAVRNLTGDTEGGRLLIVRWDRDAYRPGETATADIRLAGQDAARDVRLTASLAAGTAPPAPVPVEPVPGQSGLYRVKLVFAERGEFRFTLAAARGQTPLETYEKAFAVQPLLSEGAQIELDQTYLRELAGKTAATYAPESELHGLKEALEQADTARTLVSETSLVHGRPWFAVLVIATLVTEWLLRRRMNLL